LLSLNSIKIKFTKHTYFYQLININYLLII